MTDHVGKMIFILEIFVRLIFAQLIVAQFLHLALIFITTGWLILGDLAGLGKVWLIL